MTVREPEESRRRSADRSGAGAPPGSGLTAAPDRLARKIETNGRYLLVGRFPPVDSASCSVSRLSCCGCYAAWVAATAVRVGGVIQDDDRTVDVHGRHTRRKKDGALVCIVTDGDRSTPTVTRTAR